MARTAPNQIVTLSPCEASLLASLALLGDTTVTEKIAKVGCTLVHDTLTVDGFNFITTAINYTASASDWIFVDSSGGAVEITLPPSPSVGDQVVIQDLTGTNDDDPTIVRRNGEKIYGVSDDITLGSDASTGFDKIRALFVYSGLAEGWLFSYSYEESTLPVFGAFSSGFDSGFDI